MHRFRDVHQCHSSRMDTASDSLFGFHFLASAFSLHGRARSASNMSGGRSFGRKLKTDKLTRSYVLFGTPGRAVHRTSRASGILPPSKPISSFANPTSTQQPAGSMSPEGKSRPSECTIGISCAKLNTNGMIIYMGPRVPGFFSVSGFGWEPLAFPFPVLYYMKSFLNYQLLLKLMVSSRCYYMHLLLSFLNMFNNQLRFI